MNTVGEQYEDKKSGSLLDNKVESIGDKKEEHYEIMKTLKLFHAGYVERDLTKVDAFVNELFVRGDDTYILGTASGEFFCGSESVKMLIKEDWEDWGNVNIDYETPLIKVEGNVAWVALSSSVQYTFEDTPERFDSYLNFIKNKIDEIGLTARQKLTFIHWILTLTYHQRDEKKREYLWPMCISGVLMKRENKWKFAHLFFSIHQASFPDERFENSNDYVESFHKQKLIMEEYNKNQMSPDLKMLLTKIETELIGRKFISDEVLNQCFALDSSPYVIGTENQYYEGISKIHEFFIHMSQFQLSLDLESAIISKFEGVTWVTVAGVLIRV